MSFVAWKMLVGDPAKYLGLVFAIAFASMLMAHQTSIFVGLMQRTTSQIQDIRDAEIWVTDPRVVYFDAIEPLPDNALLAVRGVPGVDWAVPLFKGSARARAVTGELQSVILLGVDDSTLAGSPRTALLRGTVDDLRRPDAVLIDDAGYGYLFPGQPLQTGRTLEMNDRRAVIAGIYRASPPFQTLPVVYTRYGQARAFVGAERKHLSIVLAHARAGEAPSAVASRIRERTGLQAMTREDFAWRTIHYYLTHTGIPVNFGITVALAFIVGAVVAGQTFYIFTLENIKQFGALKAIGVTNGTLARMILLQATIVGVLGFSSGVGLAALFFETTNDVPHLRGFYMPWQIFAGTGAAVVLIVVLASLLSLRRVFVLEPAVVFR